MLFQSEQELRFRSERGNVLRYGIVVKLFEAINGGLKEISSVSSKTPVLSR